jgi:putative acetyltransferase
MTSQLSVPFSLRVYQPRDLPAIAALYQASISQLTAKHYDAEQRQAWAATAANMPAWQTRLLVTAPGYARQGVATALYAAAETRLRASGAHELFTEASLGAQAFFARQGFSVQQTQTVTRGAVTLPRMLMRKTLEPR